LEEFTPNAVAEIVVLVNLQINSKLQSKDDSWLLN
jgi:hypothetical protein